MYVCEYVSSVYILIYELCLHMCSVFVFTVGLCMNCGMYLR